MAKQMEYTAATGTAYPASYWRASHLQLDLTAKTGWVRFVGYADAAARQAGRAPVGELSFEVDTESFLTYFTEDQWAGAYAWATANTHFPGGIDV